jgi:hypothetical protein
MNPFPASKAKVKSVLSIEKRIMSTKVIAASTVDPLLASPLDPDPLPLPLAAPSYVQRLSPSKVIATLSWSPAHRGACE